MLFPRFWSKGLPLPVSDLALLATAARDAGAIAKTFFGQKPQVWDKPDDAGPVTEADLAVNAHLETVLQQARPDYGWLSEESSDDTARLAKKHVFVVDPIDGTRAFIEGARDWAVSLAVVTDGQPTAAAVYLPQRDALYTATLGKGAMLNNAPLRVQQSELSEDTTVLSNKWNFRPSYWKDGAVPQVARHFRSSLAFRMCLVAQARFDAMLTLRPTWEWDIAAGALIVAEAGGAVLTQDGDPPVFNNPHPQTNGLLAGALPVCSALHRQLAPTQESL